ncbi:MAG: hypothetical protein ACI3ZP_04290 [Candidatus Cryptobacteroides sp.]
MRGETASSMNSRLRMLRDQMKDTIKYFEANDINPDEQMLQDKFEEKISRFITPKTQRSTPPAARPKSLLSVFDEFMDDCGTMNAWSEGTYGKMPRLFAGPTSKAIIWRLLRSRPPTAYRLKSTM